MDPAIVSYFWFLRTERTGDIVFGFTVFFLLSLPATGRIEELFKFGGHFAKTRLINFLNSLNLDW